MLHTNMNVKEQSVSVAGVGQNLFEHSKSVELAGKRGLVVELFPSIFGASERMSARAISRFLEETHGIKLSAVTITKALNDPKRSWNLFFDTIEPYIETYENWDKSAKREEFLYDDKRFRKIQFPGRDFVRKQLLKFQIGQAMNVLVEKWYSID